LHSTQASTNEGSQADPGWWYISIGLAFVALAGRAYVAGASGVWLRLLVAAGFVLLGIVELRRRRA